jgi:hypothetical protein
MYGVRVWGPCGIVKDDLLLQSTAVKDSCARSQTEQRDAAFRVHAYGVMYVNHIHDSGKTSSNRSGRSSVNVWTVPRCCSSIA